MRIDIALKNKLSISRQKARVLIEEGKVRVNGNVVLKLAFEVLEEDNIEADSSDSLKYVGRGGLKLEKALAVFEISVTNHECLDIGASTGGFTDCLLKNGAKKVFAVDVGSNQLADSLREDSRVVSMENTDIRGINLPQMDFICADVSFIAIEKILGKIYELLKDECNAVVLVKPQFEAGREQLNRNGIVKNPKAHKNVLLKVIAFAQTTGFVVKNLVPSPIKGGDGNREYLMLLHKGECKQADSLTLVKNALSGFKGD